MIYPKRYVRIQPNPNAQVNLKLKRSQAKVNSAGQAIQDQEGNVVNQLVDVEDAVQVPGTVRFVKPRLTASGIDTGLNILVDNPYKDEDVYYPSWGETHLKGKDKALLQHILEYKHDKELHYYTGKIFDRITPSEKLSEAPFFASPASSIPLNGNVTFLDLENPTHEVWYYSLRAPSMTIVCNSYDELMNGSGRSALYYIVNEEEVENAKTEKDRQTNVAASALEKMYNESNDSVIKLAKCLENSDRALTKNKAYTFLNEFFKRGEIEYNQFSRYVSLYYDAARRQEFFAAASLQEYIDYGIMRVRENKYYWMRPETDKSPAESFEWATKEKVIHEFLIAPEYHDEVEIIESILKSRYKS